MGSPPRGRGKVQSSFLLPDIYGITPAWAGKSWSFTSVSAASEDHPAWAGKSFDPYFLEYGSKDHPRVGGEKLLQFALPLLLTGSPPRGRGKETTLYRADHSEDHPRVGGEKTQPWLLRCRQRGSPRVGGEKRCSGNTRIRPRGSPPRGRGKVSCLFPPWPLNGITPAWAGKSWAATRTRYRTWDHPRVGGEKV